MDIYFDQASVLCQSNFSAKESLWQMTIQPKDFQRNYHLSIFESLNKRVFQKNVSPYIHFESNHAKLN